MSHTVGRKCLVIGGSRGIGREVVRKFLKEDYVVTSVSRTSIDTDFMQDLTTFQQHNLSQIFLDMNLEGSAESLRVNLIENEFIPEIIVFSIGGPESSNDRVFEDYPKVLRLNFLTHVETTLSLLPLLKEQKNSKLVYIGSLVTKKGRGPLPYVTSKAALLAFVQNFAHNFGMDFSHVETFMVSPGPIEVPGKGLKRLKDENPNGLMEWLKANGIAAGRLGKMSEVANLIFALSSQEVGFIHGANIEIDGGAR